MAADIGRPITASDVGRPRDVKNASLKLEIRKFPESNKDFLTNEECLFLDFSLFIWKEILIKMIQEISGFPVSDSHFWRP